MKKFTTSLRITLFLLVFSFIDQTTTIASSVLPKVTLSKKSFTDFCTKIAEKTGIRSEWVYNFFQNVFHAKNTDLLMKLFPTLTGEKVDQIRNTLIKNEILDVTKNEPVEMTTQQMTDVAVAIGRYLNTQSENRFAAEVTSQVTLISKETQIPVSKIQLYSEKLTAYTASPVFSAEVVNAEQKN